MNFRDRLPEVADVPHAKPSRHGMKSSIYTRTTEDRDPFGELRCRVELGFVRPRLAAKRRRRRCSLLSPSMGLVTGRVVG